MNRRLTYQDLKVDRENLQRIQIEADLELMACKLSLYVYMREKYGSDFSQWIQPLEDMLENPGLLLLQRQAVKSTLKDLEAELPKRR